jgi:hypothetical protein
LVKPSFRLSAIELYVEDSEAKNDRIFNALAAALFWLGGCPPFLFIKRDRRLSPKYGPNIDSFVILLKFQCLPSKNRDAPDSDNPAEALGRSQPSPYRIKLALRTHRSRDAAMRIGTSAAIKNPAGWLDGDKIGTSAPPSAHAPQANGGSGMSLPM